MGTLTVAGDACGLCGGSGVLEARVLIRGEYRTMKQKCTRCSDGILGVAS